MPMPPPTSSGSRHVEPVAVAERAEDVDALAGVELRERDGAGADRIDQKRQLAAGRETQRERPRQQAAGRLEHEELAGDPR